MRLPGGIATGGGPVGRHCRIWPVDGRLELDLWETCAAGGHRVTCIDRFIDSAVTFDIAQTGAAELSTGDRQFIMAELARHFAAGPFWKTVICTGCEGPYDIAIDLDRLPVTPAGDGYPRTTATISSGEIEVRVPTGADQAAVASIEDEMEAVATLAQLCIVTPDRALAADPETRAADLAAIDDALQAVAPQVATSVSSRCPDCGTANDTAFDTTALFAASVTNPFPEVHAIAMAYHWSEAEILALSRDRRRTYLALIDAETGTLR